MANSYLTALDRAELLQSSELGIDLAISSQGFVFVRQRAMPAIESFQAGLSRCAVIEHLGLWDLNWDSHSDIEMQSQHFQTLFTDLDSILFELSSRPGTHSGSLLDEVTVVVLSEMGRAPALNALGGKDHWTFTSAMMIGAGVSGGQTVGAFRKGLLGEQVSLSTGQPSSSGTILSAANVGATVLTLAGLDAGEHIQGAEPISAVIA